ncbi:unnamed protein product, partial [Calicophoron daubneyi]
RRGMMARSFCLLEAAANNSLILSTQQHGEGRGEIWIEIMPLLAIVPVMSASE